MGYTVTKTTNGKWKFTSGFSAIYIPAASAIIKTLNDVNVVIEDLSGNNIIHMDETLIDSPWGSVVTPCTFDFTGGALEDLWTSTAHGFSVGDRVRFTAIGTGAEPYTSGVDYFVVNVPTANTFQLSLTKGGAVVEGTADSVGTWSLTNKNADDIVAAIENL